MLLYICTCGTYKHHKTCVCLAQFTINKLSFIKCLLQNAFSGSFRGEEKNHHQQIPPLPQQFSSVACSALVPLASCFLRKSGSWMVWKLDPRRLNGWNLRLFSPVEEENPLSQTIMFNFRLLIIGGVSAVSKILNWAVIWRTSVYLSINDFRKRDHDGNMFFFWGKQIIPL